MSRWNKNNNRFSQTVVPVDNLVREKENSENRVAIGTVVGVTTKWGDCKFTSIRSSCYNMGALSSTSPIQNTVESPTETDLNDTKITVETTPKPRKFFKSRNSAPPAEIQQQQMAMQQQHSSFGQQHSYQNHLDAHQSREDEEQSPKRGRKKPAAKKEKVEKPPRPPKPEKAPKPEKIPKPKKEKKVKVKEEEPADEVSGESDPETPTPTKRGRSIVEPTRSSGRSRAKCVNYNEDAGEDEFYTRIERRILPRGLISATVTKEEELPTPEVEEPMTVPVPQQSPALHPPIVLRISKGTSRLISTDNEDTPVSGDENKNVTNAPAVSTTDELIEMLSGEAEPPIVEPKPEKIKIRIKKDYIRSYNDSLKEQAAVVAPAPEPVPETRVTRRRGKQQEASPLVSEFDSQSSVLGSENTNTGSTGIIVSDMDGSSQASLAAAPPSGEENSSNIAMDTEEPVVTPQKGRRGRKKAPEVVMKPPEPAPPPAVPPARKTRTRNAAAPEVADSEASVETVPTPVTPEKPAGGRVTRNTRSAAPPSTTSSESSAPAPRANTRKRKNPAPVEEEKPAQEEPDQSSALNLSQKTVSDVSSFSSGVDRQSLPPSTPSSSTASLVPEYKHKKLVKRSWEQDKLQQAQSLVPEPPAPVADNSVKLLISKKKGSIFKSRAMDKDEDNNKKQQRLNLYKHKWDEDVEMAGDGPIDATKKPEKAEEPQKVEEKVELDRTFDDFEDDTPMRRPKFVRNVKKAHQIQEIGEFQEMDDDVEYLLDALQPNIQVATRCLSALQLASKCMTPSFRMHIRAHGIVPKFFKALEDAPTDASLGLCTAMVMFALSQDTLKMDLDRGSLELMLNLLECEGSHKQHSKDNKQHFERKQKVRELCEEIQSQGKSIHLNLEHITAAQLAMESLLSLTSKRAGEWLKEDLRELGGIEHIIKTVCECCHQITEYVTEWTEPLLEKLNKIERCLRILENVTSNNEENQKYVLHHKSQVFVKTLCRFFNLLHTELTLYPTTEKSPKESAGVAIREALVPLLKVIINLTHPFNDRAIGSVFFGDQKEIFQISINVLLFGPSYVPTRLQFDLSVLTLVLLNNLAQSNEKNRQSIMQLTIPVEEFGKEKHPAIKSLVEYFYKCEDKARMIKKMTDEILENPKDRDSKQKSQDDAVNALIQHSGSHMEHTILASVTSILIGFVVMENQNNEQAVRRFLRDGKFTGMVETLRQYYEFLNLTVSSEASSMAQLKTIKNVIDYLQNCDSE